MTNTPFNPEDMPILNLDTSNTCAYEASLFIDSTEQMNAYLAETRKAQDPQLMIKALAECAKALARAQRQARERSLV